jgi:hypothetical protein
VEGVLLGFQQLPIITFYVTKHPTVEAFLHVMVDSFVVIVFTAGLHEYMHLHELDDKIVKDPATSSCPLYRANVTNNLQAENTVPVASFVKINNDQEHP